MGLQSHSGTETILKRIAWLSKQNPERTFECLMHLFNQEALLACFHSLDKNKAVGIDGINKAIYAQKLEENIERLISSMKNMAYIPGPVREVLIPKEGKPGAVRPLGISNLEDKIVQKQMQKVLESMYEPLFLDCSFGFRPGKGCHDAIKELRHHLYKNEVQVIIDIDLKNFFGTIDHTLLEDILKQKIKDPKFMRYINRMFKAGVLSKGEMSMSEEGVPQGSICSPILANIFAHYAIDLWIQDMVQPKCRGTVKLIRYADDAVICCQYKTDAVRIQETLGKRLAKYKLQLNEEKTKLVNFSKEQAMRGIEQGTFDFLGFTFYLGKSRAGRIIPKLMTRAKTMRVKLSKVAEWAKQIRNRIPIKKIWEIFTAKTRGHIQYYGVSFNIEQVADFLYEAKRILFKWLNRRSQKKSFTWEKFALFIEKNPLPEAKIVHPLF